MKMTPRHYLQLEEAILPFIAEHPLTKYLEKGLNAKRWRWDLLWAWKPTARNAWFEEVYTYCDDTHIDTALRRITETF